ncbi:hypothetical protein OQA88_13315 [Cercophora sp. LCS_1]
MKSNTLLVLCLSTLATAAPVAQNTAPTALGKRQVPVAVLNAVNAAEVSLVRAEQDLNEAARLATSSSSSQLSSAAISHITSAKAYVSNAKANVQNSSSAIRSMLGL